MDAPAFRFWARLMHRQPDHHFEDAMIAATAAVRGLTVATRNIRDYKRFGVKTFDPFSPRA
jgi:predicted nucleic acid-binding protein